MQKFEAVPPRIVRIEAVGAGEVVVFNDFDSPAVRAVRMALEIIHCKCGMGFARRLKFSLDADVKLTVAALEPASSAGAQRFRFFDFAETEHRAVKSAVLPLHI